LRVINHDQAGVDSPFAPERIIYIPFHQQGTQYYRYTPRTVLLCPRLKPLLIRVVHLDAFRRNALEDIVNLTLGDVEDGRVAFWDVPENERGSEGRHG